MCGVRPSDEPNMEELDKKLGLEDLTILIRGRKRHRLRLVWHVERSSGEISRVPLMQLVGKTGHGRPRETWS